ncbi:hypothetical protein PUMCH_000672 [Australozyma saopauloensis]|uniref:Nucleoporin POM33 n=1 Tax=Australozyma saopauloensis TaxID=291208 RepID=A0AAX4H4E5_9ASCO|nr:hypothetical protein PUMCH_000672 [[Candida] saopauloensis]
MSTANSNQGTPSKPSAARTAAPDLVATVQTLQFAWFVGHALTLISSVFFYLTYVRVFPSAYGFWYKAALFGVIESFGVLIYQSVSKNGFAVMQLLRDSNVQYLALALALFVYSPYVALTLATFLLFSTFHVLSYVKHNLFPALAIPDTHPVSVKIGEFIAANNNRSIALASVLEVYTGVWLFVRLVTFRANSLVPFVAYAVFLKLRFEKSQFTRNAFKSMEVKIDDAVNASGQPVAKDAWVSIKGVFYRIGAFSLTGGEPAQKST